MVAHINTNLENQEWLPDLGANAHITADACTLSNPQPFEGTETVGVGNGTSLKIKGIGSSLVVPTNSSNPPKLLLKDILLCPSASANLLSINKFCIVSNCHFTLIASYFLVKDNMTGAVLLQGPSNNGLYPIPLQHPTKSKVKKFSAFLGVKTTNMVWHQRLGHPSTSVF